MKTYIPYSLILAAAASGLAFGAETAYTTPVGYDTQVLKPGQFTLAGLTLQLPTAAAGVLDAASAGPNTVTDTQVNFTTTLTVGATYILELPSGVVQEITSWSGSVLTTPDNITASVVAGTTTYKLRKAASVSDVFGATNSVGLTSSADVSTADKILIPNASGGLDTVFYYNDGSAEGWLDGEGNLAADKVVAYPDGFYVQRVAAVGDLNLVVSGEVKTKPTSGVLVAGYNYLNGVAPVGLTLDGSNLKNFLTQTTDAGTADNVLLPTPSGGYTTCFYYNDGSAEGWLDGEGNLAGEYLIQDGFLIFNRGVVKPYTISTPTSYSSL